MAAPNLFSNRADELRRLSQGCRSRGAQNQAEKDASLADAIACKLLADGLTVETYTRDAALAILSNCVGPVARHLPRLESDVLLLMGGSL